MLTRPMRELVPLIEQFASARILCVGDLMLDRFIYGDVSRISPEAPIPVLKRERESVMLGGAGNVVRNIISLGAECCFISVIGDDAVGHQLTRLVGEEERLEPYLIIEKNRRSSEKSRYISGNQQLLRCDDEMIDPVTESTQDQLLRLIQQQLPHYDLLILSDYAKGVLTDRVIRGAIDTAISHHIPVFVDPKRHDASIYRGATLLSPNAAELAQMVPGCRADDDASVVAAAQSVQSGAEIGHILVTRGKAGMSLIGHEARALHIPAYAREVFDVSGAGDTVIATLAVAHASELNLDESALLANLAASIVVGRLGTAVIYRTDLKAALYHLESTTSQSKILPIDIAEHLAEGWKQDGKIIGFTNGCFDLLHVGHLQSLQDAKALCDRLIVGINSDESVRRLKGAERPINAEMDRAMLLAGLDCVDLVVIFREDTPEALLARFRPDILMKGADYTKDQVVGADLVASYGGRVELLPIKEGYSSTTLMARAKQSSN